MDASDAAVRPLAGRVIAIPETRELDRFAELLQAEGAAVRTCPLVAILDAPDPAPVEAWIRAFADGSCDDLIAYTGEGIRRLLSAAERIGLRERLVAALLAVRVIARGPKPTRELVKLGKRPELTAEAPTTDGLIATLSKLDLKGRRVGVQLYGSDPNERLIGVLKAAGAQALPVAPYVYAPASDDEKVRALVAEMAAGKIDVLAITYAGQVRRLQSLFRDRPEELKQALAQTDCAAVGPVCAMELRGAGVEPQIALDHPFVMKNLVRALAAHFASVRKEN
ncbi:MAG: uroporphyrinogen-III synthase [Planctomycetes bacterium]|nr:uroporphyrinogen-III synthase [Planctomycetota bacterium]